MAVESKAMDHIRKVLEQFGDKYFTESGTLKRNTVIEDLDNYDKDLMTAILKDNLLHKTYTSKIADVEIFEINKFVDMLRYKEYWEDSFTKYDNKIGLTAGEKYIDDSSDVVLDFPYKDCILKAGMTKEDVKHSGDVEEPFLNETLAKPEIDELLEPKIFINATKYDQKGQTTAVSMSDNDNLIVKGNNLIALYSLEKRFAGKIKLIYLDPPYNTGSDSFRYNDNFNQAAWLTFMKNRLEIAKVLLRDDGVIFVQCDDNESNYLGVILDEIFKNDNFINIVTVKTKLAGVSGSTKGKSLKDATEFIHIYAKNKNNFNLNSVKVKTNLSDYIQQYEREGKSWKYTSVLVNPGKKIFLGSTKDGSGDDIKIYGRKDFKIESINAIAKEKNISINDAYIKYADQIFQTTNAQSSIRGRVMQKANSINNKYDLISIEYVPKTGKNKGQKYEQFYKGSKYRLFAWLRDILSIENGNPFYLQPVSTLWDFVEYNNLNKEGKVSFENGKKPESLLERIIKLGTNKNDIVLDFFMGSATTQSVAMKMHRRFIGIDQMDYVNTISIRRLQEVIRGEQNGISKDVEWQGGGSFIYVELMKKNQEYLRDLQNAENMDELMNIYARMKQNGDIDFRVDLNKFEASLKAGELPSLEDRKKELIRIIDKNQLYYNYSNIDDESVRDLVSDTDYEFNKSFYSSNNEKGEE